MDAEEEWGVERGGAREVTWLAGVNEMDPQSIIHSVSHPHPRLRERGGRGEEMRR